MKLYHILPVLVLTALLFGLSPAISHAQSSEISMVVTRDPISLDPHGTLDPGAPILLAYLYDTLVYQAADGSILPSVAESWEVSEDQRYLIFDLKSDILFSDGSSLNADAVIYTFERLQAIGQRSLIFDDIMNISSMEKLSDYSVGLALTEPSATLLSALTYPYAGILSPTATEAAGDDYGRQPVGSGPFQLAAWVPENEIVFVPNPNYRGHRPWADATTPPAIDRLRVRFSTDEAARASALLTGEVDIAYFASGSQLNRFDTNDFSQLESPARGMVYLGFNTQRVPFDNVEVRRAIAQAINKADILALAADGLGLITQTALPPSVFAVDETLANVALPTSPEEAIARLRDAGYGPENPINLTILTSTFPTFQAISTVVQAQLAAIGINVSIDVFDFSVVSEMASAGDYDVLVTRYDWNDPDVLRRYLGSENIGTTNRFFYSNPQLDLLLAEGRTTFDQTERRAIYLEAQRIILNEVPILPIYVPVTMVVVSDRITGARLLHSHVVLDDATVED